MRRQRNFNFNPHITLINNPSSNLKTYLNTLITLSQGIHKLGFNVSSGMRILKNIDDETFNNFFLNPTKKTYYSFLQYLNDIKKTWIQTNKNIKISDLSINTDNHFLFNVYLTNPTIKKTLKPIALTPEIQFIRTQRRYNKRRYSRVRAVSRPSFWSGAMISTVATSMFWGSTLQGIDWISVTPIILDINPIIVCLYFIVTYRLLKLNVRGALNENREKNKQRRGFIDVFWNQTNINIKW